MNSPTVTKIKGKTKEEANRSNLSKDLQSAGIVGLCGENGIDRFDARAMLSQLKEANERYSPIEKEEGWEEV